MTFNPLGRVFSVALKGRTSDVRAAGRARAGAEALVEAFFWAMAITGARASRIAAAMRNRVMESPLFRFDGRFYLREETGEVETPPAGRATSPV
jgi:hypothetical protein